MRLFLAKLNPSIHVTCVRKRQSLENLIGFLSFGVGEKLFCMKERERERNTVNLLQSECRRYFTFLPLSLYYRLSPLKLSRQAKTRLSKNQLDREREREINRAKAYFYPALISKNLKGCFVGKTGLHRHT